MKRSTGRPSGAVGVRAAACLLTALSAVALRAAALGAAALAAPAARAAPAAGARGSELDSILHSLARSAPSSTPFIEARFSPLLTRPLVVSGELRYLGPGSLVRIVEKPYRERAEIHGEAVTVRRGGEAPQHFSLDQAPEMRSL
ncbi:MAG: LolA-related protein, partial [Steroidobacteraceae bacterium]